MSPAYPFGDTICIQEGQAEGMLFGGTLSMLAALCGTGHLPGLTGAILYVEDVNEQLSRIDRMLWQLRQAIPFSGLSGIIFGQFTGMEDTSQVPFGFAFEEIVREHTADLGIPVLVNAPFGHGEVFYAMPLGIRARLSAGGQNALTLLEPLTGA